MIVRAEIILIRDTIFSPLSLSARFLFPLRWVLFYYFKMHGASLPERNQSIVAIICSFFSPFSENEFDDVPRNRSKGDKRNERPPKAIIRIIRNTHKFKSQAKPNQNQAKKINTKIKPKQKSNQYEIHHHLHRCYNTSIFKPCQRVEWSLR